MLIQIEAPLHMILRCSHVDGWMAVCGMLCLPVSVRFLAALEMPGICMLQCSRIDCISFPIVFPTLFVWTESCAVIYLIYFYSSGCGQGVFYGKRGQTPQNFAPSRGSLRMGFLSLSVSDTE